jgi:hypothetical protein
MKFEYLLEYKAQEIVDEQLRVDGETLIQRHLQDFDVLPNQLKPLEKNIRRNQNLLFFAQSNNVFEAKLAYSWFLEDLIVVNTEQIPNVLFKSLNDRKFKDKFLKFLRAADFNITDVEVKERQEIRPNIQINFHEGPSIIQEQVYDMIYDVYSTHNSENNEFQIHFNNESTGTQVLMLLALYILNNENSGKVLLIDEFDRSFHIELAEACLMSLLMKSNRINSSYQHTIYL